MGKDRVRRILEAAAELPPGERTGFIERECAGDPGLQTEVKSLLAALEAAEEFLIAPTARPDDAPTADGPRAGSSLAQQESPGTVVGRYKLLQVIGEGGFGTVWMAEQTEPVLRRVALKIIKLGMDTKQVIARFEAERQALALMDHPNIARVFDAGATEVGRPYFVMELVRGEPITEYCDRHRLPALERLSLFAQVCRAVQHAHQKGIIHRDVKPSNVLVTVSDGRPLPKVIDFGIAKATSARLTERTLFTEHRQLVGTPEYMSPEQAEMLGVDVDTRTDVYSLGVLLYELLTGATPFDGKRLRSAAFGELLRIIREEDPPTPSGRLSGLTEHLGAIASRRGTTPERLGRLVRGELDWIVMRALEKDRTRRYETASALAADVERFLRDEPVEAGPPSAVYRLRKALRRHRTAAATAAVVAITLLAATGVSVAFGVEATRQRKKAESHLRDVSAVASFQSRMLSDLDPAVMAGTLTDLLTADVARTLEYGIGDAVLDASAEVFADYLRLANPTNAALSVLSKHLLEPAEQAAESEFADRPLVLASLLGTIADSYMMLGLPQAAERPRSRSIDLFRAELGESAAPTLDALQSEAAMLSQLGRSAEAEQRLLKIFAIRSAILPDGHPDTLCPLVGLADAAFNLGQLDVADARYRRALDGFRDALGPDAPETLTAMNSLGNFLGQIGRIEESERLLRDAYEGRLRTLGDEHPDTLDTASSLGALLNVTGRFGEGEAILRESLAIRRRLHGDNHPSTITNINNLATLLSEYPDRADECHVLLRLALEANLRLHGPLHQDSLLATSNLATFHAFRREHELAEPLLRQVWLGSDAVLGPEHPDSIISRGMYSSVLRSMGRHDEARMHLEASLGLAQRHLPPDHLYVPVLMVMLGKTYLAARDPAAAVPVLLEAATALEGLLGSAAGSFLDAAAALADAYDMLNAIEPGAGHADEAAKWRARLGG